MSSSPQSPLPPPEPASGTFLVEGSADGINWSIGRPHPLVAQVTGEELSLYAAYLARDFEYERSRAEAKSVWWYLGVVGREACTWPQAILLRELTALECDKPRVRSANRKMPEPDALRDFAREEPYDVDGPDHRRMRARLMAALPDRVQTGIADVPGLPADIAAAVDEEFEHKVRAFARTQYDPEDWRFDDERDGERDDEPRPGPARLVLGAVVLVVLLLVCLAVQR